MFSLLSVLVAISNLILYYVYISNITAKGNIKMTSRNNQLNECLKFAQTFNSISKTKKISQLEALKIYLEMTKTKTV